MAALGDFSFDMYGYCMALTSVFFQVSISNLVGQTHTQARELGIVLTGIICVQTMYLILVEKSGADDGLSSMELMFYNSILSIPFLFFIIIATGEFPHSLSVLSEKVSRTGS